MASHKGGEFAELEDRDMDEDQQAEEEEKEEEAQPQEESNRDRHLNRKSKGKHRRKGSSEAVTAAEGPVEKSSVDTAVASVAEATVPAREEDAYFASNKVDTEWKCVCGVAGKGQKSWERHSTGKQAKKGNHGIVLSQRPDASKPSLAREAMQHMLDELDVLVQRMEALDDHELDERFPDRAEPMVLGLDIGGVLNRHDFDGPLAGEEIQYAPGRGAATPGMLQAVKLLAASVGPPKIHIISKAKISQMDNSREWLRDLNFYQETRIPEENVHFCREVKDKGPEAERLGLTHMVDDRDEALQAIWDKNQRLLKKMRGRLFHFARSGGTGSRDDALPSQITWRERPTYNDGSQVVVPVRNWMHVLEEMGIPARLAG